VKPSEALDKAVEVIERDGWIQGAYYREPPVDLPHAEYVTAEAEGRKSAPCCQRGAIVRAVTGTWRSLSVLPEVDRDTIRGAHGYCRQVAGKHPIEWNDDPGRTKEEVVEMLKSAAGLARNNGE
jgi:hypothetical protein